MNWPSMRRQIQTQRQLLVEGRTAEIFFREWVEAIGMKSQVEVRDYGSLSDLPSFLKHFTQLREFRERVTSMAIIRDAEENPAVCAFDSVCAALKTVGISCPNKPCSFSDGPPRAGVFVLPDCQQPGMLETLCWAALCEDKALASHLECVTGYLACLQKGSLKTANEAKARVWTYLAGKGEFDPQVGRAAQAKTWNWQTPALQPLAAFLKSL